MAATSDFVTACKTAARQLRRLPAEVRRTLGARMGQEVAAPLAADIARDWSGPYARVLAAGTKARVGADPTVVVGGATPRLSGGAGPRTVVYGAEFGGGSRRGFVTSPRGRRYARHTTRQFPPGGQHAIFGTVEAQLPELLEHTADLVLEAVDQVVTDG